MSQEISYQQALSYASIYAIGTLIFSAVFALASNWRPVEGMSSKSMFNACIALFHIAIPILGGCIGVLHPAAIEQVIFFGLFLLVIFCEPIRELAFMFGKAMLALLFIFAIIHEFNDD